VVNEREDTAGVIAPPPLIFAIPGTVAALIGRAFPVQVMPQPFAFTVGVVLTVAAIALDLLALQQFRRAQTPMIPYKPTTAIIDTGPFARTRNPIYLAMVLLYIGITLIGNTIWPLLSLPFVLAVMQRGVIEREERYLERKFGDEYLRYKSRVRRWL
jgi:protein-S-isoprenylcysteine O-methyltransferase Ste14